MNLVIIIGLGLAGLVVIGYVAFEPIIMSDDISTAQESEPYRCQGEEGRCYQSTLSRIIDGDTIVDEGGNKIRLALTSTPELDETGGLEAKKYLEELCPVGSKITVNEDYLQTGGSFGRIIAEVTCNGKIVNAMILLNDHGIIDKRFCNTSEFSSDNWAINHCQ